MIWGKTGVSFKVNKFVEDDHRLNNLCTKKLKHYAINAKDYFYNPLGYCKYNNKILKKKKKLFFV